MRGCRGTVVAVLVVSVCCGGEREARRADRLPPLAGPAAHQWLAFGRVVPTTSPRVRRIRHASDGAVATADAEGWFAFRLTAVTEHRFTVEADPGAPPACRRPFTDLEPDSSRSAATSVFYLGSIRADDCSPVTEGTVDAAAAFFRRYPNRRWRMAAQLDGVGPDRRSGRLELGQLVSGATGGTGELNPTCASGRGAPEARHDLRVHRPNTFVVWADGQNGFDLVLSIHRGTCAAPGDEIACNDDAGSRSHSQVAVPLTQGDYCVVVDGFDGAVGAYQLEATARAIDVDAQRCARPGAALGTRAADHASVHDSLPANGPLDDMLVGSCGGEGGPDRVHVLTVAEAGTYELRLTSEFDGVLYLRDSCSARSGQDLGCNDDDPDQRTSRLVVPLQPGSYFVVVDAFGPLPSKLPRSYQLEISRAAEGQTP